MFGSTRGFACHSLKVVILPTASLANAALVILLLFMLASSIEGISSFTNRYNMYYCDVPSTFTAL